NDLNFSIRKYPAIVSLEQRQCYSDDFNAEYEIYLNLHGQIDKMKKRFKELKELLRWQVPGSKAHQVKKEK
ncbi:ELL factor, partial [Spelaeornis formosus]|nr:ELL factor [Elachura formosa]